MRDRKGANIGAECRRRDSSSYDGRVVQPTNRPTLPRFVAETLWRLHPTRLGDGLGGSSRSTDQEARREEAHPI